MRSRRLLIPVALMAAACSPDGPPEPSFAVSDSAGVEVVTTARPPWDDSGTPWRLSLEVEIGELDGAEPYLFGDPVGAVRLDDGRIAVADAQSADIRFFSGSGEFLRRFGRRGEGPGEFASFSWLARCGAGLLTYDWQQRRVTKLSPDGTVGDTFPLTTPEAGSPPYRARCLPDGSILAVGWGELQRPPPGQEFHFHRQTAELWRLFLPGDSTITLGTYISSERLAYRTGSGPHPFSRSVAFAGTDDRLYIGGAERLQVEVRTPEGSLMKLYRGPDADLVIDDAFVSFYRGTELSSADSSRRALVEAAEYVMPDRYPAYVELLADPLGYVWVERFTLPWDPGRRWGIFDPDGLFLGHLDVPADFQVTEVSEHHLVGIARDELGVGRVRVYRLDRSEPN